ncbi:efflux RND transporter periplasmic adaptor subunit [Cognatilysobacter bugurensis]|uniref:Resistance-nodulation-cell division (RND) efflux membrane fusion protein n=1 Tax=Cognatilysobacter bugurensis TaxID=543356 RepID=A0A918W8I8_9GAMM|nr:efflux RND transporter periplasmic adaptor subunit [Lysobacter bugurensis]GHA81045.1 resistance-nodulation-cell division (RND) efflux membrane fusion protein [Lysobacter bugurensis]
MRRCVQGAVVALATVLLAGCGGEPAATPGARPVLVERPGSATAGGAAYAGEIRAREEAALAFRVGGKLVERKADVGDRVREGQVLASLDAGDLQAQARAAEAQLAAAQAQYDRARADRARFAALGEDQLVSRSAVDAQNAAASAARGQLGAARANVEVARNQRGYTQLRAPEDGVIAARFVEAGQVVAAGQPVYTLAADGGREVAFAVGEGAVRAIAPGTPVEVELWSQSGKRFPGRVREVAPAADPATRTFAVRASLDAPAGAVELGQSARVHVASGGDAPRISVPLAAVQRANGGTAVYVVDTKTSRLRLQPVQLGAFGDERVPVLRGLAPDAWVVAAGGHLLQPGQTVRPVDRDNRPLTAAAVAAD